MRVRVGRRPDQGVNIAGYFRAELGVGEIARRIASALRGAGVPCSTVVYDRTLSRQAHAFEDGDGSAPFDVNLICVNADQLPLFANDVGRRFFRNRYSIGVWFWEVAHFPRLFHPAFHLVDEVWAASEYVRGAIAAETDKPTRVVPVPIEELRADGASPIAVSAGFVFLFSFDFQSVFERKNPLAAIRAFERAFDARDDVALLMKTINGAHHPEALERLRAAARHPRVHVVDGYLSARERDALTLACDACISLHRSEGFGLTIAEAMAAGKPAIATGYSGNLEFMTPENSYLVPYELTPVPAGSGPYPEGVPWAEPDVERAAELMRHVFDHREAAAERGRIARADVLERFSSARCAAFIQQRLAEIRSPA